MVSRRSPPWLRAVLFAGVLPALAACFSLSDLDGYPCAADGSCASHSYDTACVQGVCRKFDTAPDALAAQLKNFRCATSACPQLGPYAVYCVADTCVVQASCDVYSESPLVLGEAQGNDNFCSFVCDSLNPCPGQLQCELHVCNECTLDSHCAAGKCCARTGKIRGCYPADHLPSGGYCTGVPQPATPCDVVKQDCTSGKCSVALAADGRTRSNTCVAVAGSKRALEPCTRSAEGADDCASGLFCSQRPPAAATATVCLGLCNGDRDCDVGSGLACLDLMSSRGTAGTCSRTCSPFAPDCDAQHYCVLGADPLKARLLPFCQVLNVPSVQRNEPEGAACTAFDQCQTGMGCETTTAGGPTACVRYCDAAHACPTGACTPIPKAAKGLGACTK
jgi:hypothetical protein